MRFFYTTSAGINKEQTNPLLSLGGYQSTAVPNSRMNNLFGDITPLGMDRNEPIYIGLFLQNTTGAAVTNIKLWFDYPTNCYSKFEVAAVATTIDAESNPVIEHITNNYATPFSGTFYEADGVGNAVDLGDLASNGLLGIWIKRTILKDVIVADYAGQVTKPVGADLYVESELGTEDEISVNLSWN
jgi:hypothetical protein